MQWRSGSLSRCTSAVSTRRRQGESRYISLGFADAGNALVFDFIDANDRLHGYVAGVHIRKLLFQFFFTRVDKQLGAVTENKSLQLNKAPHVALIDMPHIDFVHLVLIDKTDTIQTFFTGHGPIHSDRNWVVAAIMGPPR